MAVHDERFHGHLALPGGSEQNPAIEGVREWLRTQRLEQGVLQGRFLEPQHAAEASWVGVAQDGAAFHDDVDVIMFEHQILRGRHPQAAGHAQMHQQAGVSSVEQQVFAAPLHAFHQTARQLQAQLVRHWPT